MSIIDILLHIAAAVLGYVIGSVNAAVIITKYILKSDVRERGSKNAGAANVTRVFGPVAGGCTLLLDMAKVMFVMWLGGVMAGETGTATAAIACLTGHCFPIFFGFKGGKAVAVTAGIGLYMDWRLFLICIGIYLLAFLIKKTASIASLSGVTFMPITMLILGGFSVSQYVVAIAAVAFVWIMHWPNLVRLAHHEEKAFAVKKAENARKDGKVNEAKIGGGQDAAPFCCKKREYAISFVRYNISKENRTDETTHRYAHKDEKRG